MLLRFPDTGSLPHPVGWEGLKERRREALYREKSKCSRLKESKSTAGKSRILKRFSFGSRYHRAGIWRSLWQNIKISNMLTLLSRCWRLSGEKEALFADVFRILRPGGLFIASDWMRRDDNPPTPEMEYYIEVEGLNFGMASPDRYAEALAKTGFMGIQIH